MLYAFNDADAPERRTTQYFEMFGNRAIYRDGWFARTLHRVPWQTGQQQPLTSDVWDLYNVREDFSLTRNLAEQQPQKLAELQALFMIEAEKYHVLPIDDRTVERMNPTLAGRPDLLGDRTSLTLYEGMDGILVNTFINVKNRSKTITAELEIPTGGANGVILAHGGRFGGWSLYMQNGRPVYTYNFLGLVRFTVASTEAIPAGPAEVVLDFAYDVVWSDGRQPGADGKLPAVGNTVDVAAATWTNTIGDSELITVWTDPEFDPSQRAFYYLPVLEIPTPRWTAYDANRFGTTMDPEIPMVTQERAYTSPIWYTP